MAPDDGFSPGPRVSRPDGVVLATWDLGGHGHPLVLLHATGLHGRCWLPLAAHLRSSFHCFAVDLRGHGASSIPISGDFDWRTQAGDIRAAVAALGLRAPSALGHSGGGAVAVLAELQAPTWNALYCYEPVLPDPGLPADGVAEALAAGARRRRQVFESRAAARANYGSKLPFSRFAPAALSAYVDYGFEDLPGGGVGLCCRGESEAANYEASLRHRGFNELGRLQLPVTVAAGGEGSHLSPAALAAVSSRIPGGRAEIFGELGHFGPMEDPAAVAASVLAALIPETDTGSR